MSLNRTAIEWTDYTWNPVTGCEHNCSYCYARSIATRFNGTKAWPNGFKPTFHPERLDEIWTRKIVGRKVFVCSMADLFGDWVPTYQIQAIIEAIKRWQNGKYEPPIFQFLTKNPKRYAEFKFPKNCWLGTTVERGLVEDRIDELVASTSKDNVRFVSIEPILGHISHSLDGIDWVIIGAMTGNGAKQFDFESRDEAVYEISKRAIDKGIPDF